MTTTFKEGTNGFYCAECRMSFAEPLEVCPYCGSIVSNYEEIIVRGSRANLDIVDDAIDEETYKKIQTFLKEREFQNESNVSRTN
jgi:hypothetical protein